MTLQTFEEERGNNTTVQTNPEYSTFSSIGILSCIERPRTFLASAKKLNVTLVNANRFSLVNWANQHLHPAWLLEVQSRLHTQGAWLPQPRISAPGPWAVCAQRNSSGRRCSGDDSCMLDGSLSKLTLSSKIIGSDKPCQI